jgi:hypothetical protein
MSPEVAELIDFDQPCGVLMMSVLHFVGGDIARLLARYTERLAPGSYLALSHGVTDGADQPGMTGVQEVYEASPTDPAFAYSPEDPAPGIWMLCAVGRKL